MPCSGSWCSRRSDATLPSAAKLAAVQHKHVGIATELLSPAERDAYVAQLDRKTAATWPACCKPWRCCARAGKDIRDLVSGYGEIWSTRLFSRYLRERASSRPARCVG